MADQQARTGLLARVRPARVLVLGAVTLAAVAATTLLSAAAVHNPPADPAAAVPAPTSSAASTSVASLAVLSAAGLTAADRARVDARVGALFDGSASAQHTCTASVVQSAGGDLIMTAAHCVVDLGSGTRDDLVFVPGYRAGTAPYGTWKVEAVFGRPPLGRRGRPRPRRRVRPARAAQVQERDRRGRRQRAGLRHEGVVGGPVTGYPTASDEAVSCTHATSTLSATQLRLDCPGLANSTSGSPWLTAFDPATGAGEVVGLIGGYERGGLTPDVSFSPYFGSAVQALYARVVLAGW